MTTGWNGPAMRLLQLVFAARHQPLRTSAGACALGATQPVGRGRRRVGEHAALRPRIHGPPWRPRYGAATLCGLNP